MADYAPVSGGDQGETFTYTAGAAITGGQVLYFTAADTVTPTIGASLAIAGIAGHDAASGAPVTVHCGAGVVHETPAGGQVATPLVPGLATATTTGTIVAGNYQVVITYSNASGTQETTASPSATVTTGGGNTSTITISSPIASTGATGWYAYVTQVGGSVYTRQQTAGSPTAIATPLVLTAPPTSSGVTPPLVNTTAPVVAGALIQSQAGGTVTGGAAAGSEIGIAIRAQPNAGSLLRWMCRKF
jgi:hypothetical protein